MTDPINPHFEALVARLTADPADSPQFESSDPQVIKGEAELAAYAEPAPSPTPTDEPSTELLAAYLDGALSAEQAEPVVRLLARSTAARLENEAIIELLDQQLANVDSAPDDVVSAALNALERPRGATLLRPPTPVRAPPAPESFLPLAAASTGAQRPLYCRSQSGIWTLEVFIGESSQTDANRRGHLLLTVHAEHRTTYEGLLAKVYVGSGENARILAEELVRDGEVYAAFELNDLDFWTRDAVSVIFEPADRGA